MLPDQPIEFMIVHQDLIIPIYRRCQGKSNATWEALKNDLPELGRVMKFNTFKQYLSVMTTIFDKLGERSQTETTVIQELDNSPKRILGWSVQKGRDGYYRCYRKIRNKVHSIYLGKTVNIEQAQVRIQEKESTMRLDMG